MNSRVTERHPRGLSTLFFTEMWERMSYYGMRALLVLFMTAQVQKGGLGFTDEVATAIYGLYTAGVYLAALPGGWIADRLIGAQRAVWIGGSIIAAGHFLLGVPRIVGDPGGADHMDPLPLARHLDARLIGVDVRRGG